MNPEQITAYVLGELPPAELAAFEAQLHDNPGLQKQVEEIRGFCTLLGDELSPKEPEVLTAEQRFAIFNAFSTDGVTATRKPRRFWGRPGFVITALAAAVAILLMLKPEPPPFRSDAPSVAVRASQEKVLQQKALQEEVTAPEHPPKVDAGRLIAANSKVITNLPAPAADMTVMEKRAVPALRPFPARPEERPLSAHGTVSLSDTTAPTPKTPTVYSSTLTVSGGSPPNSNGIAVPGAAAAPLGSAGTSQAPVSATLAQNSSTSVHKAMPVREAAAAPALHTPLSRTDFFAAAKDQSRAKMLNQVNRGWEERIPIVGRLDGSSAVTADAADGFITLKKTYTAPATSPPPPPSGTQTYRPILENPFLFVANHPLSTFSLDTDTASYANVRRLLNAGERPPGDAVRLEELINYFPYQAEAPGDGKALAVHVDVAEAPWQPLHRLARIVIKARETRGDRPPANFVFLLDVSGSMEPRERLPLIKKSLHMLVEQLRDEDRVAIVTYAGESGVALPATPGSEKEKILQAIDKLQAGGSTNGASGIRMAYEQAALNYGKDRINRIILCTDGDFNVGVTTPAELEKLVREEARGGVFLSVLGVGTDNLHDHTMQVLADCGHGNYHYLDSLSEARKVLVEQMQGTLQTVAKDAKTQVEFNPAQVAAYRLLGYEKRALAKEDFNDDRKTAGIVGAGHTVTVLYEIVPASLKYPDGKPLVDDLKYQKPAAPPAPAAAAPPGSDEVMTVKIRYQEPNGDKSQLIEVPVKDAQKKLQDSPKDFQFAASVAAFGMLLRDSPHVGDLNWETVRRLALSGKGEDEEGWRGEFIQLIEKARGLTQSR